MLSWIPSDVETLDPISCSNAADALGPLTETTKNQWGVPLPHCAILKIKESQFLFLLTNSDLRAYRLGSDAKIVTIKFILQYRK